MTLEEVQKYSDMLKQNGITGIDYTQALSNNGWAIDGLGVFSETAKTVGANGYGIGIGADGYGENNFDPGEKNAGLQTVTPNSVIGDNKLLSLKGLIGDGSSTGVLKPAFNAYMAYKKTSLLGEQLEETKRMNLAKEQAMKDANMMLGIEKDNVVRQANRYANIGAYGTNSQGALMRNMVTTQYRKPNPYNRVG